MPISSTVRKAGPFTGNGSTVEFAFAFKIFEASDLSVIQTVVATGVETELTLTTDYSVALNADQNTNPGGTVTTVATLTSASTLTIISAVPNTQPVDLSNQGGFYPGVINDEFDRLTILIQQLQLWFDTVEDSVAEAIAFAEAITASAEEINTVCDGDTAKNNHVHNTLDGLTASIAEINTVCDGATAKNDHTHPGYGAGDVTGPASSVADNIASFDDETGIQLKDSGISAASVSAAAVLAGSITASAEEINAACDGSTAKNSHIHALRGCLIYKTSAQEITANTPTLIIFGGEEYDTDSMHTTAGFNAPRITIPAGVTRVRFSGLIITDHSCSVVLKKDGGAYRYLTDILPDDSNQHTYSFSTAPFIVAEGEYFTIEVTHTSAGFNVYGSTESVLLQSYFAAEILE